MKNDRRTLRNAQEPRSKPAAAGRVLVHNQVAYESEPFRMGSQTVTQLGGRGFRAWTQKPSPNLVRCKCSWSPPGIPHYRVR
jgi:hypothetical protein